MTRKGALRLALDINALVADILSAAKGLRTTAANVLVEAVRTGTCPAGPVQLVTSLPIIENYANVLVRRLGYEADAAEEKAWILEQYAREGPMPGHPFVSVGSGYLPFETEEELHQSISNHIGRPEADKLFHEIQDDRYVLETALVGHAGILVTADLAGFAKGPVIQFERNDVLLFPLADRTLVISTPRFVVYWLSQGVVPDAQFIDDNPKDFVRSGH